MEAKVAELNREQKTGSDALVANVNELLSKQATRFEGRVNGLHPRKAGAPARISANRPVAGRSADFDGLVLLMAPERSGSTWLFDLIRCHPAALFLPTVDIFRQLGLAAAGTQFISPMALTRPWISKPRKVWGRAYPRSHYRTSIFVRRATWLSRRSIPRPFGLTFRSSLIGWRDQGREAKADPLLLSDS